LILGTRVSRRAFGAGLKRESKKHPLGSPAKGLTELELESDQGLGRESADHGVLRGFEYHREKELFVKKGAQVGKVKTISAIRFPRAEVESF